MNKFSNKNNRQIEAFLYLLLLCAITAFVLLTQSCSHYLRPVLGYDEVTIFFEGYEASMHALLGMEVEHLTYEQSLIKYVTNQETLKLLLKEVNYGDY